MEGILKEEILHVAESLFHDHVPAKLLGLDSVWIKRNRNNDGAGATPKVENSFIPKLNFNTLLDFVYHIEAE
jgi:FMN phosphatase YigB (HAD superfamily)